MRKKLIAAIIVLLVLVAAGVGVIVYMETRNPSEQTGVSLPATSAPETTEAETEAPEQSVEATAGISLPTEESDEVTPEVTFGPEDTTPVQTVSPDGNQDENATGDFGEVTTPGMPL